MNYNHINEMKEISKLLKQQRQDQVSSNIDQALSEAFSGVELIMRVRFILKQNLFSKRDIDKTTQDKIKTLLNFINKEMR